MNNISLTSSMRSNLLSLQQTAKLQDATQNRLATGKKVNSAIDSPSAYYTAQALNNRAKDLSALLDAMSQGVQTIKAATTALDSGMKFLEQARAAANYAYDEPLVPKQKESVDYSKYTKLDKAWFQAQAGANSAVVETADELKDAIAAGKETIVVYGKIDMGNQAIALSGNQKLVGTEYFANIDENALYRDGNTRFSELKFDLNSGSAITLYGNARVSNLKIDMKEELSYNNAAITATGTAAIDNVDINVAIARPDSPQVSGILINGSGVTLSGKINIIMLGNNLEFGIYALSGKAKIDQADIKIDSAGSGMIIGGASKVDISNSIFETTRTGNSFSLNSGGQGGNTLNINENVIINSYTDNIISNASSTVTNPDSGRNENIVNIKAQTKIFAHNVAGTEHKAFEISKDTSLKSESKRIGVTIQNFTEIFPEDNINKIIDYYNFELPSGQQSVYEGILQQYDNLIKDSTYKGVNLLQEQNLKVNFNEDRSSQLLIKGQDASLKGLKIDAKEWKNKDDIQTSLEQIASALNSLREMSSELGNYYSIVTNREEFTSNLINVLSEGADKLTLADMNEESANMLALQTRQQLAINSLSLASQANQSILKLF